METYVFHVSLADIDGVWRKIELRGDQTLEDLHQTIQAAYDWGADHLYSFFMSGKAWDTATEYAAPEDMMFDADDWDEDESEAEDVEDEEDEEDAEDEDQAGGLPDNFPDLSNLSAEDFQQATKMVSDFLGTTPEAVSRMLSNMGIRPSSADQSRDASVTRLDSLGLRQGQTFLYLFDYGDEWHFHVRVEAVQEETLGARYPRLVESVGEAPAQYPNWDEDEDEAFEDEDTDQSEE